MAVRKSLKTMSGMILNRLQDSQPKFAAKSIANELMFESHAVTSVDRASLNQSAFANNHLLCYWLTIHNSISKISPKFQVISFDFVEVKERLDEHWAKIVQSENISLPIYHYVESLWNMTRCNYQSFASKNCGVIPGISCLALIFNLSYQRTIILQAKKRFQVEIKRQFPVSRETWFYSRSDLSVLAAPWSF